MKEIYYLKKDYPFFTAKRRNSAAIIDVIDRNVVYGYWVEDNSRFQCMIWEFDKIFR